MNILQKGHPFTPGLQDIALLRGAQVQGMGMLFQDVRPSSVGGGEADLGSTHHAQGPPAASWAIPHQELLLPRHLLLGLLTAITNHLQQAGLRWWGLFLLGHCGVRGRVLSVKAPMGNDAH